MKPFHQMVTLCDEGNPEARHQVTVSSHRGKPAQERMTPEIGFSSLVFRETQTKTTVRYDFVFPEMIKYQEKITPRVITHVGKRLSCPVQINFHKGTLATRIKWFVNMRKF